jgi:hypothetical protein
MKICKYKPGFFFLFCMYYVCLLESSYACRDSCICFVLFAPASTGYFLGLEGKEAHDPSCVRSVACGVSSHGWLEDAERTVRRDAHWVVVLRWFGAACD